MYETLALLTVFVLVYSSVAGAIERSWISGPIMFTCFGLLIGPVGFDLLSLETDREMISGLAEVDAGHGAVYRRGRRRHGRAEKNLRTAGAVAVDRAAVDHSAGLRCCCAAGR